MSYLPKPDQKIDRLASLREALTENKVDGFLVPRTDAYQNEYIPDFAQRLAWLTGFTGSAGLGIVLKEKAAVFVDGRYTLQVVQQIATNLIEPIHSADQTPHDWVRAEGDTGLRLAYDPWLHTQQDLTRYEAALKKIEGRLVPTDNLIDPLWQNQPAEPQTLIEPHHEEFTGEGSLSKRQRIGAIVEKAGADMALLTDPASIAWILNVRATDVPCTPLPLSTAIILSDGTLTWFVAQDRLDKTVMTHVGAGVTISHPSSWPTFFAEQHGRTCLTTPSLTPAALLSMLEEAQIQTTAGDDPCSLPRAHKTTVEITGSAKAHIRDGVAVTRFLAWLDRAIAAGETVTELQAEETLTNFRKEIDLFRDISFEPISGAGPHGAIVHYRATPETDRPLDRNSLYLIDSGGQYLDGTTDITRTIAIGTPTDEMTQRYTQVLKGHIALALQRFPQGTTGAQLDILARSALWQAGVDYAHGTGHGVGSYLGVHEGPQRISSGGHVKLHPGMILSNEPGYYQTNAFGIRIENLVVVRRDTQALDERQMLAFDTLTCAPIDTRPINANTLLPHEKEWLNAYHTWVRTMLTPHLDTASADWLMKATKAI